MNSQHKHQDSGYGIVVDAAPDHGIAIDVASDYDVDVSDRIVLALDADHDYGQTQVLVLDHTCAKCGVHGGALRDGRLVCLRGMLDTVKQTPVYLCAFCFGLEGK
jgi:hypothetical protein